MKRIVCVGDALTLGVRTTRGYPEHLWEILHRGQDGGRPANVLVHNAGLPVGSTLVDVVRALPATFAPLGRVHVAVLLAPPYDARGGGTPPREFRALLEQAVVTLGELTKGDDAGAVVLATPTPIGSTEVRGFARPSRRWVVKAAEVVRDVGHEHELQVANLHEMPVEHLADGVHLKPTGYRWVAEAIAAEVRRTGVL